MVDEWLRRVESLWDELLERPHEETALRISALLLLLYPPDGDHFQLVPLVLGIPMVLDGRAARSKWLWLVMTLNCLASTWAFRYSQDNHKYLLLYWTTACCLSVWAGRALQTLAHNGRLLLALVFTFAGSWKILGGQVLNGDFFEWAFLTDSRFFALTGLVSGIDRSALALNRSLRDLLDTFPSDGLTVALNTQPGVETAALAMGWAMTVIELSLALAFWVALARRRSDLQDWILIVFCAGTYTLTPVVGFGTTLAVMGFAQAPPERRDLRDLYLWVLILVQFAKMPILNIIQGLIA